MEQAKLAFNLGDQLLGTGSPLQNTETVGTLASNAVVAAISAAGIIFVVYLIMAGIGIIGGGSGNNPEKVAKGKQAATAALVGFVVVFASYWIVQLVKAITGLPLI